jgi:CBS domain-containing protein
MAMKVAELMRREVVTVPPGASLKDAARLLVEKRISGMPVVDDAGGVLGVLSETDIVAAEAGGSHTLVGKPLGGAAAPHAAAERHLKVARVPGVVVVRSELSWAEDDTRPKREPVRERARYPL